MAEPRAPASAGTVAQALGAATDALAAAGVDSPRLDAELLLAEATGLERAALAASPEAGVDPSAARTFGTMMRRRIGREPVAYILGRKGFRNLDLRCDSRALVPRPETELLVEVALEEEPESVLDVGTGSGGIALAIADELAGTEIVAVDVSAAALELARENAAALGLGERVSFGLGALLPPRRFDLIVANLPYVRDDDWSRLPLEISRFEPPGAVLGGADGLDPIRNLASALLPGSTPALAGFGCEVIALEIGAGQADEVTEILIEVGLREISVRRDLAGIDRVVIGRS